MRVSKSRVPDEERDGDSIDLSKRAQMERTEPSTIDLRELEAWDGKIY